MRSAVSGARRSGLLKANDTAVLDTPASRATSAIRARAVRCSTRFSLVAGRPCHRASERSNRSVLDAGPRLRPAWSRPRGGGRTGPRAVAQTGLANRFSGPYERLGPVSIPETRSAARRTLEVGYDGQPMIDRIRAMPGGIRLFLLYAALILAGIGLSLRSVV